MPMDIDKLEAGPELDALVAEKVMGWKLHVEARGPHMGEIAPDGKLRLWVNGHECKWNVLHWKPSTDIAAAWEVVEKLGLMVMPVTTLGGDEISVDELRVGWAADVQSVDEEDLAPDSGNYHEVGTAGWAHAPTAPLAICRAALKAVGA